MSESQDQRPSLQILVCDGPSCGLTHESALLKERIEARIASQPDLARRCTVLDFTCFGRCDEGPNMLVHRLREGEDPHREPRITDIDGERGFYLGVDEDKADAIVDRHCAAGEPLDDVEHY